MIHFNCSQDHSVFISKYWKESSREWIPTKWLWCSFIMRLAWTRMIVLEMITKDVYICDVGAYLSFACVSVCAHTNAKRACMEVGGQLISFHDVASGD